MQYDVWCKAYHPMTGQPLMKRPRRERIDTVENVLFKKCKTILDVLDTYQAFWNHLNDHPREIVMVYRVVPVKEKR